MCNTFTRCHETRTKSLLSYDVKGGGGGGGGVNMLTSQ